MNVNENEILTNQEESAPDVIEMINDVKANMVTREEYEKALATAKQLKMDNARLVENALINSYQRNKEQTASNVERLEELSKLYREKSRSGNMLEAMTIVCEQQDIRKDLGLPSMFYPTDPNVNMTESEKAEADKLDKVLHDCVKYANGNSELFMQKWGSSIL